jgi:adenine-specific DNA-methyltransferase
MPKPELQQNVLNLLKGLRGIEPLKKLFWSELNYQRVNQSLSRRGWTESANKALTDDPVLFAGGGEDNAFHVIYCRLASDALARGFERPVVTQLLREHPYALFVFSNKGQTDWHFLNVKYDDQAERRRLFRRITVRPGAGLRTATERLQLLDLAEINPELFGITPLAIQQRCDAAFDVETVTKDFFREIANWYFWALKNASFPKDAPKEADGHDHISIIRLITRLIFCWFVKEKGLIPDTLFDERNLGQTLTGFAPDKQSDKESVFYKAILQNLFFATLNTEMEKRGWTKEEQNFMAHSLYRRRELFSEPKSALDLFKEIPFLNGGLFECLDKDLGENAKPRYVRIDGFSRRDDSQPIVPDFLFFGREREVDLSADYNDAKFRRVSVRGLIHIFNRYNFTVEENTPVEQEVALDPELSGKVFENLLAAYNPETGATARKQTGSFYTPREIVNYMVDEALIACLKTKLEAAIPSAKDVEAKLRHLFAYNDEPHQFTPQEVDALIAAIDGLKSLDPAVGSGAFPMGILHKLVFVLGKLDPRNEKWKERQIARVRDTMATAEKIEDATARERAVGELEQQITGINEAFEHNELDYGRKLYLIENCIYGVDIQPIAVQIAKMRFFISLIVDQKIDDTQPNRGVRPLPNLETKFVAANTLIGVNRPGQQLLRNREIDAKQAELRRVRERHFLARTPRQKVKCRDADAKLRAEISELLKNDGWDTVTARKLAAWDPYDQNASADFFDAEWMFNLADGFDVVVGNPPYIAYYSRQAHSMDEDLLCRLRSSYEFLAGTKKKSINTVMLFLEKGLALLQPQGVYTYIVDIGFFEKVYAEVRNYISRYRIDEIVTDLSAFENVASGQLLIRGTKIQTTGFTCAVKSDFQPCEKKLTAADFRSDTLSLLSGSSTVQVDREDTVPLGEICDISCGLEYGALRDLFLSSEKKNDKYHKAVNGGTSIPARYALVWEKARDGYVLFDKAYEARLVKNGRNISDSGKIVHLISGDEAKYQLKKLLIRQSAMEIVAAYDDEKHYALRSLFVCTQKSADYDLLYILAILNSRFTSSFALNNGIIRYSKGKQPQIRVSGLNSIPIKKAHKAEQLPLVNLAKKIIAEKRRNPAADTSTLEREIDKQVCAVYDLTPEVIKIVEAPS